MGTMIYRDFNYQYNYYNIIITFMSINISFFYKNVQYSKICLICKFK